MARTTHHMSRSRGGKTDEEDEFAGSTTATPHSPSGVTREKHVRKQEPAQIAARKRVRGASNSSSADPSMSLSSVSSLPSAPLALAPSSSTTAEPGATPSSSQKATATTTSQRGSTSLEPDAPTLESDLRPALSSLEKAVTTRSPKNPLLTSLPHAIGVPALFPSPSNAAGLDYDFPHHVETEPHRSRKVRIHRKGTEYLMLAEAIAKRADRFCHHGDRTAVMKEVTAELAAAGINKKQATFSKNWSKIYAMYVTSANAGVRPMLEEYFHLAVQDRNTKISRLEEALRTVYNADCEKRGHPLVQSSAPKAALLSEDSSPSHSVTTFHPAQGVSSSSETESNTDLLPLSYTNESDGTQSDGMAQGLLDMSTYASNISPETLLALEKMRQEHEIALEREKHNNKMALVAAKAKAERERLELERQVAQLRAAAVATEEARPTE
mmetsp:Transcript_1979/g.4575  ORF Transcript_1979/g.4575 Transcript_1979/m.4575 type:complete len:440 (-) Transcript_1979:219-1538(-)